MKAAARIAPAPCTLTRKSPALIRRSPSQSLDLSHNPLGGAATGLAGLASADLPALRRLRLEHMGLTPAGLGALAAARFLGSKRLESVYMWQKDYPSYDHALVGALRRVCGATGLFEGRVWVDFNYVCQAVDTDFDDGCQAVDTDY